jgi:hypothetical protein
MAHVMQQTHAFSRHAAAQFKGLPPLLCCGRLTSCSVRSAHTTQPLLHDQGLQSYPQHAIAQHQEQQQQRQQVHQQQQQSDPEPQQLQQSSDICTREEQQQQLTDDWLQRSRLLVGPDGLDRLAALNVLLVGLGGVGSFAGKMKLAAKISTPSRLPGYLACRLRAAALQVLVVWQVGDRPIEDGGTISTTHHQEAASNVRPPTPPRCCRVCITPLCCSHMYGKVFCGRQLSCSPPPCTVMCSLGELCRCGGHTGTGCG